VESGFWEADHQILLVCIHCSMKKGHHVVLTHTLFHMIQRCCWLRNQFDYL